jgi:hypothetical protein
MFYVISIGCAFGRANIHAALASANGAAASSAPSCLRYWQSAPRKNSMRFLMPRERHTSSSLSTLTGIVY